MLFFFGSAGPATVWVCVFVWAFVFCVEDEDGMQSHALSSRVLRIHQNNPVPLAQPRYEDPGYTKLNPHLNPRFNLRDFCLCFDRN